MSLTGDPLLHLRPQAFGKEEGSGERIYRGRANGEGAHAAAGLLLHGRDSEGAPLVCKILLIEDLRDRTELRRTFCCNGSVVRRGNFCCCLAFTNFSHVEDVDDKEEESEEILDEESVVDFEQSQHETPEDEPEKSDLEQHFATVCTIIVAESGGLVCFERLAATVLQRRERGVVLQVAVGEMSICCSAAGCFCVIAVSFCKLA